MKRTLERLRTELKTPHDLHSRATGDRFKNLRAQNPSAVSETLEKVRAKGSVGEKAEKDENFSSSGDQIVREIITLPRI